jgi:trafficking protein particle complex subunit 8
LLAAFPTIPKNLLQSLFPLYSPYSLDLVLFWKLPSSDRRGFVTAFDIQLGVGHGLLNEVIEKATENKGKSIYAETKREHELLLQHFRECEWNRETDPVVVAVRPAKPSVDHDFAEG